MAWDAIKFDWNHIRAFLAVAETGSLSAAARRLGQTQPTVGRQVAALESDLDVLLFDRDVRGMRLT
ncbi:MAG: LysR family transcriptional regulator, partial [Pseudomonadota bacterium]|nr:LysR family transcriptional regulator [Pseudomonadota bacterium]